MTTSVYALQDMNSCKMLLSPLFTPPRVVCRPVGESRSKMFSCNTYRNPEQPHQVTHRLSMHNAGFALIYANGPFLFDGNFVNEVQET